MLICTSPVAGGESVYVDAVKAISGEGIEGDRYCGQETDPARQLTLIESEVINQFNRETRSEFPHATFRRNIVTEGIRLNNLVGKIFYIGGVKLCGKELCEPCLYLQEKLKVIDLVKHLTHKGGLCCEILTSGTIQTGDNIII